MERTTNPSVLAAPSLAAIAAAITDQLSVICLGLFLCNDLRLQPYQYLRSLLLPPLSFLLNAAWIFGMKLNRGNDQ